jgi:tRNA(Ile)-lysidine synthase
MIFAYGVRKEADEEVLFVKTFSEKLGLKFFSKKIDISNYAKLNKIGTEEAGRKIRYEFFYEILKTQNANKIATAHNANDRAETVLLNLLRGSGIEGLKGFSEIREDLIIKPVSCLTRDEIENYCKENDLNAKYDKSNNEPIYTRNKIKLKVLPLLKAYNPNIIKTLNRTAMLINDDNKFLEKYSQNAYNKSILSEADSQIVINNHIFNENDISIKRRIIRKACSKLLGDIKGLEMVHIERILELSDNKKTGKKVNVFNNLYAKIEYEKLILYKEGLDEKINFEYKLNIPGKLKISN